jgi:hypothetical protein
MLPKKLHYIDKAQYSNPNNNRYDSRHSKGFLDAIFIRLYILFSQLSKQQKLLRMVISRYISRCVYSQKHTITHLVTAEHFPTQVPTE